MEILIAAVTVAFIGALCAVMLVLASKFFSSEENEKVKAIRDCLPGANCGACGYAGCDGYAKALSTEEGVKVNLCAPGGDSAARQIAEILGVDFEDVVTKVAVIHCYGDCDHTSNKMDYVGINSCEAAKIFYGGRKKCSFGCIGLGDCVKQCPNNAICIEKGIAHIDTRLCIGCGICARACPQKLIEIVTDGEKILVTCNNKERGVAVRSKCTNGCIGCKKCEKNCPEGAIKVVNNLAIIDYELCTRCGKCAVGCPSGCILVSDFSGIHRYNQE